MLSLQELASVMNENGMDAHVFENAAAAKDYLLNHVADGASVGIGGSVTAQEMGLAEALREKGHEVHWHWEAKGGSAMSEKRRLANASDVYICSANAMTEAGALVNADGTGNRLAASFYGPADVWFVVGKNKLVANLQDAIDRIDNVASPLNCERLGIKPTDRRIYSVITIIDRPTAGKKMHVLLINEDLGY